MPLGSRKKILSHLQSFLPALTFPPTGILIRCKALDSNCNFWLEKVTIHNLYGGGVTFYRSDLSKYFIEFASKYGIRRRSLYYRLSREEQRAWPIRKGFNE